MEGKIVTYAACNHGSTALVTDKGELYMFGKDAIHCEATTGIILLFFFNRNVVFLFVGLLYYSKLKKND